MAERRSSGAARFCSAPVETSAVRVSFSRTVAGSVRSLLSAPVPSAFSRDQPELPRRLSWTQSRLSREQRERSPTNPFQMRMLCKTC